MSKGNNQKIKLSILSRIMLDKTDEDHGLTMPQIMAELERYDISAERKSIYSDFQDMTESLGIEIVKEKIGRDTYYSVGQREFELAEVKLLIDAIQSSKFITEKKSRTLIKKIKGFVSEYQAKQLQRQVYINDRVKTMNESVYYNVDEIHSAINSNNKIRFKYYKWDINKELVPKHEDEYTIVSPWAMVWDDENYYMVAFDDIDRRIKHYRVDKMMHIDIRDEKREGKELFKDFDMARYTNSTFGMYGGELKKVRIEFPNDMCGVFIDRFGKDVTIRPVSKSRSIISVEVAVSPAFFGWVFSLGSDVKVAGPDSVMEEMRSYGQEIINNYN